jgi:3-oxoacyl-[acyl-carrier-protein] synthase-1
MIGDVVGVGARGPVGLSSMQLAMCARARKLEPRTIPGLRDKRGQEIGVCLSGGISLDVVGYDRLVALAAPAIAEAAARASAMLGMGAEGQPRIPAVVSLPPPGRADDDPRMVGAFVAAVSDKSGVALHADKSSVVRVGHAGMAAALVEARTLLDAGEPAVLVGAVDSYFHPAVLRRLDEECRLHALGAEDGFVPSEGSGFALLVRTSTLPRAAASQVPSVACITGAAIAEEAGSADGNAPNAATAMTSLIAGALDRQARPPSGPEAWVLSDVNGEHHRVGEWDLVSHRHGLLGRVAHDRFADQLGDMGAATGGVLLAIATGCWRAGAAPCTSAVLALHSDGPARGVVVLEEAPRS